MIRRVKQASVLFGFLLFVGGSFPPEVRAENVDTGSVVREADTALEKREYDRALGLVGPLTREDAASPDLRRIKVKALARLGKPVDALREYDRLHTKLDREDESLLREVSIGFITAVLKDMREQMRGAGYTALKDMESDDAIPYFEDGLSDGSGLVRALAAEGLGRLRKGRESPRLRQALEDQAAMVRVAALKSLGRSGDRSAVGVVEKYVKDDQSTVRVAAAGALVRLGRKDAWELVRDAARQPNPDERGAAFKMLGELQDKRAKPILEQGLADPQPSIRAAAATALGELGDADATGAIERLLADPIPAVRAAGAVGLGQLQAKQSIVALRKALADPNPAVKSAVVDALLHGGVAFEEIAETLRDLMQNTDPGIRAAAAKALARTQASAAGQALGNLRMLLNDPLPRPRIAAARSIGHLNGADRGEVVKALKGALADQDDAVRATAAGALVRTLGRGPMLKAGRAS